MSEPDSRTGPGNDPTDLFVEYLAIRDAGGTPDVDGLCARAGDGARDLRDRIRALAVLDGLGRSLREIADEDAEDKGDGKRRSADRIGRYRDLRFLGEGGLSRVYVARDPELERDVALKVIANAHVTPEAALGWIRQEGRTLARLEDPGVVHVFDLGIEDGETYVAMELVDGPSLADVLDELRARRNGSAERSADPRVVAAAAGLHGLGARAELGLGIARALAACHAAGVLHRDMKPGNVLLESGLRPKLIDFGLAHLEASGGSLNRVTQRLIGTPAYIAPEQVERGQTGADPRSDQFSFGVVLYELLTLATPFHRGTRTETLDAVARALPARPRDLDDSIPADLETICLHALERDPADRYPSMAALAGDLAAFLDHRAIAIRPPGAARRMRLWARRNRRDLLVGGVPLVLVLVALFVLVVRAARSESQELEATLVQQIEGSEALSTPATFEIALSEAESLHERSRDHEHTLLGGIVGPDTRLLAGRLADRLSERLASVIAAQRAAVTGPPAHQDQFADDISNAWQRALLLETRAAPGSAWCTSERERGSLAVAPAPPGLSLRVFELAGTRAPFAQREVPWPDFDGLLRVGEFRLALVAADGAVLSEIDLTIRPGARRRTIEMRPLAPALHARLVDVAAGGERGTYGPAAALRVWDGWVTCGDIAAIFAARPDLAAEAQARGVTRFLRLPPEDLPSISPADAMFVAEAAGLRLPTMAEVTHLVVLRENGGLDLPPLPPGFGAEALSGRAVDGNRGAASHVFRRADLQLREVAEHGHLTGDTLAFRLVATARRGD